jgi:GDP-L-fucose synthase
VNQILKDLLDIDGYRDAKIVYDRSKPTMIPIRLISTEKAERVLGFKAKVDLQEGLRRTLDWYRKNR